MVETRWNKMFLLLMLVLQFSGALSRQRDLSSIVREGDEVILPCESVMDDHQNCDKTTWIFSNTKKELPVELVAQGQIKNNTNIDRLSLTPDCSLVIKKVTVEDAGYYTCRRYTSTNEFQDAVVYLSAVNLTEHKVIDKVTLNCSVETNERCKHTVKWLFKGQDVDKDNPNIKTSQSSCSATVSFVNNFLGFVIPHNKLFKCSVSTEDIKESLTFKLHPSDEDTETTTTTANNRKDDTNMTGPPVNDKNKLSNLWWLFIVIPVVVVALLIIAVKVIRTKKTKGKNTQRNDNVALTSESTVAQSVHEISHDMADPEDGVSYASISYTNAGHGKAKIRSKKDDGDTVTYSTVKTSSPDPSSLYATVNNPSSLYATVNNPSSLYATINHPQSGP